MSEQESDNRKRERPEADTEEEPPVKKGKGQDPVLNGEGGKTETDKEEPSQDSQGGETKEEVPAKTNGAGEKENVEEPSDAAEPEVKHEPEKVPKDAIDAPQEVLKETSQESLGIVVDRTGTAPVEESSDAPPGSKPEDSTAHKEAPPASSASAEPAAEPPVSGVPSGLPPGATGGVEAPAPVDPTAPATLTNPDQIVEERSEVPALYVGKVIGKGGEMIRDLQARSGARIDVDQSVPPGQPRVITYRGTRKTVDFAKMLVNMLCQEGVSEAQLPLGEARREILIIPSQSVGKVIGRGGEMIRELQSRSAAKIQIDHSGTSGVPSDKKQLTIIGTEQAVVKAKEMVMFLVANPMMDALQSINMLIEDKVRGSPWGSGPPYANLPNQGYNMTPDMFGQGGGGYGGYGGYQQQQPTPGGYGPPSGGAPSYPMQQQQQQQPPPAQMPSQAAYGQYNTGQAEADVIWAQKQYMGRIIGQRGVTVNDLQQRSGCDIQINQNVAPGQDCEITLRGSRQGIEMAKQMIREILESGPAHPYAGGADRYRGAYGGGGGGGGGGYGGGYQQQGYDQSYGGGYGQQYGGYGQAQQQQYGGGGYGGPAAAAPAAVSAWKTAAAPDGSVYYYNEATGETQWDKPAGMM